MRSGKVQRPGLHALRLAPSGHCTRTSVSTLLPAVRRPCAAWQQGGRERLPKEFPERVATRIFDGLEGAAQRLGAMPAK